MEIQCLQVHMLAQIVPIAMVVKFKVKLDNDLYQPQESQRTAREAGFARINFPTSFFDWS